MREGRKSEEAKNEEQRKTARWKEQELYSGGGEARKMEQERWSREENLNEQTVKLHAKYFGELRVRESARQRLK